MIKLPLGRKIYETRMQLGFTQVKLGHKLGVSNKTISAWEHERSRPDGTIIAELASLIGLSYEDFMVGVENEVGHIPLDFNEIDFVSKQIVIELTSFASDDKLLVKDFIGLIKKRRI